MINKEGFSKEVMETFKYTFSKPGACTAALNYYRMVFKTRARTAHRSNDKIEKPILLIWVSVSDNICVIKKTTSPSTTPLGVEMFCCVTHYVC